MIAAYLDSLHLPESCELDRTVFKKLFSDNVDLDATDRRALKDDIAKIKWNHTLKPSTINIESYTDQTREYPEIAILGIELTSPERIKRIASFIHKAIPYPTLLVFGHENRVAAGIADKRINQADKSRWVVEDSWLTSWFDPNSRQRPTIDFVADCNISHLPFTNFRAFYNALRDCIIAYIVAEHTGRYISGTPATTENRIQHLKEIDRHTRKIVDLKVKLKKANQLSQQITLNTVIKKHKDAIIELESKMRS